MKISVFGLGYVGTVSAACLAELGHTVVGVDVQEQKVQTVRDGRCVLVEPGLGDLVAEMVSGGRLSATQNAAAAIRDTEVSLICVGTPGEKTGAVDLAHVLAVCRQIGEAIADRSDYHVVAVRSTVIPGAVAEQIVPALERASGRACGRGFGICTNPEFLREGTAVADFRDPPMIVIGQGAEVDGDRVEMIYAGIDSPVLRCSPDEAMMAKYACNAFHAAKVTFANEIGALCGVFGLDSHLVMDIFCRDKQLNISPRYLKPGFAFGGSCLPKDVRALLAVAHESHLRTPLLESLLVSNVSQIGRAVEVILALEPSRVGVLGLSFKDKTDDLRESPVVELVERLLGKGVDVAIHDADVDVSGLMGRNLAEAQRRLPHISSLLREDAEAVIAHGQVIVVAKPSAAYACLPRRIGPEQAVVDLARAFRPNEIPAGRYHSICG